MEHLVLNGTTLTLEAVYEVMHHNRKVEIDDQALALANQARNVLFDMAAKGEPVYGLNRGVGWNKDKEFDQSFFETYNRNMLNCHSLGVAPYSTTAEVRAMMLIRLNKALCARAGISEQILLLYRDFLNHGITPRVPRRGSIGEGDITILSHIGLAMIGESEVEYQGKVVPSIEAMNQAKISPAILGPKDGLSIVSNNSQGEAIVLEVIFQAEALLKLCNGAFCLSLESINGGVQPLGEAVNQSRQFQGQIQTAAACRTLLEGSYVNQDHPDRALQDPLSYRCQSAIQGGAVDALEYVKKAMEIQLNTSDDNPYIDYENGTTAVSPNFEVTTMVLGVEMLNIALSHLSRVACRRINHMANPHYTGLERFLTPEDVKVIAYGTIQKVYSYLDTEIRSLANPSSMDSLNVAGGIEDHASNLPFVADKTLKIIDNLRYILGIELMHGAQAMELHGDREMGKGTKQIKDRLRSEIPFLDRDRNLSIDIDKAYQMIRNGKFDDIL